MQEKLTINEIENGARFQIWGREYEMRGTLLFSSMQSQGKELLAFPIRVVARENGEASELCDCQVLCMEEHDEDSATVCAAAQSKAFFWNTAITVESDGFVSVQLRVMPRGYTVRQVFFAKEQKPPEYALDRLWVEIPLRKEVAKFYQMYPRCEVKFSDGTAKENNGLSTGDFVHDGTSYFPFLNQLFFTNDEIGFGCMLESDALWQPVQPDRAIECEETDDAVILRLRLLDCQPREWKSQGRTIDVDRFRPLTFRFALQTTPFRPYPENPYAEHNVHIDCFKKIEGNYEDYLPASFVKDDGTDTGESAFDRMKRLGVNTLYIHEKWNDLQNSTLLTKRSAKRLRYIVEECHRRGIRVIPYFGYEISSLSPEWGDRIAQVGCNEPDERVRGMWNRVPFQRDGTVCAQSDWRDTFPKGIARLMDTYHFDGVYLDGTVTPWACANESHGCGYRDSEGKLHKTYPVFATRELMKRIAKVVHERNGTINCHTAGCYNLAALSMCDSVWEGEVTQFAMLNEDINEMPEGIYRGQFSGRVFGLPLFMLCYADPPHWTFEHSNALSLLLGTIPKPNDLDLPLESTSRLWRVTDAFPVASSTWHPYWEQSDLVQSNAACVKVSYYAHTDEKGNRRLLIFAGNTKKEAVEGWHLTLRSGKLSEQIPHRKEIAFDQTETLEPYGYRVYYAELD